MDKHFKRCDDCGQRHGDPVEFIQDMLTTMAEEMDMPFKEEYRELITRMVEAMHTIDSKDEYLFAVEPRFHGPEALLAEVKFTLVSREAMAQAVAREREQIMKVREN